MAGPNLSPLQRQIARVSRRLFLQSMLVSLFWCWAGALLVTACWFPVHALWLQNLSAGVRLGVAGGLFALGTVGGLVLAFIRAPSRVAAALLLDERFALKERVTTSLTLAPELEQTPAAQALLADVNQRLGGLDVGSRFPVRVPWLTSLVPVLAGLLAVAAFYYQAPQTQANIPVVDDGKQAPPNKADIEKKMAQLKKTNREERPKNKPISEELKRLEEELDKIANKPHDTKEHLKERVKELTALENQIKNREKELAEKTKALKDQLNQMKSRQDGIENGPAKDLQKALSKGNMDEAKDELDKLAKKLKNNELSIKEKEQLDKQLQNLKKQLEDLAQQKEKQDELKKLAKEGKLDAETLKRELENIKKDSKKLKDLQDIADKLGQCQKCLKQGDGEGAAQSLGKAGSKLDELSMSEDEMKDLREELQRLQDAKDSC